MSSYRRFVTYLFRYENGTKAENCGFAKVEVRPPQCRMEIQVKGLMDGEWPVHLFVIEKTGIAGVCIGKIRIRNRGGREAFLFRADAVGDTMYDVDDVKGIYIPIGEKQFTASQWEDEVVDWSSFHIYREQSEAAGGKHKMIDDRLNQVQDTAKQQNRKAPYSEKMPEADLEKAGGLTKGNDLQLGPTESESNTTICSDEKNEKQTGQFSDSGEVCQKKHSLIEKQNNQMETVKSEIHVTQAGEAVREDFVLSDGSSAGNIRPYFTAWERQWQQFAAGHMVFCPFDEEPDIHGVKMQLRDLKLLPQKYWALGNNSFLLHGYFNYKYLLFGYRDTDPKQWFLAVPGTFQNQEQLLAGLFGFGDFKTKHKTKQKTGEFGFWYKILEL